MKLRSQLFIAFLVFGVANGILIGFYLNQSKEKSKIDEITNQIHQIEVLVHSSNKTLNEYFTYDTKNPEYYKTRQSEYLKMHKHQVYIIHLVEKKLQKTEGFDKIKSQVQLQKLSTHLDSLSVCIDHIAQEILVRGYKDSGIVGTMRSHAHNLEFSKNIPLTDILVLRRYEKDYIIRNEQKYIDGFNKHANQLIQHIKINKNLSKSELKHLITEIELYQTSFNQLVTQDKTIGLLNKSASKAKVDKAIKQVFSDVERLHKNCDIYKQKLFIQLKRISALTLIGIIILSLILSLQMAHLVTRRISLLSINITEFIQSCFTKTDPIPVKPRADEVGLLIKNIELLKGNILNQINHLEQKVAHRTEEINTQNEQILEQNKKMLDSLRYALNIQEAILPHPNAIKESFPEHFIVYRPKDLVSGDFYWHKRITRKKADYSIFAVADCTGHGVPGAFMSMLGIAFLNEIVVHKNITNSGDILNQLRRKIIENLNQHASDKKVNDGMDIALILVDHNTGKLQFSGAFRDLTLIRNGELQRYCGDRMPIGNHIKDTTPFFVNEIDYQPNDMIYLFSDGFADQFGGPEQRKYLRKNLRRLLLKVCNNSMQEQKQQINTELNAYMGNQIQTDDICLAGIRLKALN